MSNENLENLQKSLNYSFQKTELLQEAITHKSYLNEVRHKHSKDNERLEFLGDAVLDLIASEYLVAQYPVSPEGELSKMKSRIVSERGLAQVARRLNLGNHLSLGKGEEMTKGREKPSLLADALEAVIAAVYIDGGYEASKKFILETFRDELHRLEHPKEIVDYKTELQEYCQKEFDTLPKYYVVSETGPDHEKIFEVELLIRSKRAGIGKGHSKKEAEQKAAREGLEELRENS